MKKEELKKKIQDIQEQIEVLEKSKKELVDQLSSIKDLTKGEQIQNIIDYGGHKNYIIDYKSRSGILSSYISSYNKYETIYLETLLDNLYELSYYAPTYKEQLEVFEMFGIDRNLSEDEYNEKPSYTYERNFEDFEDLWNDIVKEGVSSFTFDW